MLERQQLQHAIAAVEAQRTNLGEAATETALAALKRQLEELDASDSVSTDPQPPTPGPQPGERRIVTILFCDVTGSTALAEGMDWSVVADLYRAIYASLP